MLKEGMRVRPRYTVRSRPFTSCSRLNLCLFGRGVGKGPEGQAERAVMEQTHQILSRLKEQSKQGLNIRSSPMMKYPPPASFHALQ